MFTRLAPTAHKELLTFFRDPSTRRMLLGVPLLQLFLFSFAATIEVRNVEIAVLDEDSGRWSQELVSRVAAAEFVGHVYSVHSLDELERRVAWRKAIAGLHFKADFSREIVAGRPGPVQLIIDGRRANAGQITFSYINTIANDLGVELTQEKMGDMQRPQALVRHWFNPNLEFLWFIVPSLAATLSMMSALLMTTMAIARERELGTFDQLLVTPVSPLEIILGKMIPAFISGMFSGTMIVILAIVAFGIPFAGNFFTLLLSMAMFVMAIIGIGLTVSALCNTQQQAGLGLFLVMIPMFLISGFITPVENQPEWLQMIAQMSPLKHFIVVLQGSFLKAMNPADIFQNMWPMMLIAVATLTIATLTIRLRLQ